MRLTRYMAGTAIAALLATQVFAQAAPRISPQSPAQSPAAGALDPAAEAAPAQPPLAPEFEMAEGVIATVNDQIITGFDLRQRMLMLIAMTQVQPTPENIPAIQQQALNALIDERLQAQELTKYEDLVVDDEQVQAEITAMAQEVGATPLAYVEFLAQVRSR